MIGRLSYDEVRPDSHPGHVRTRNTTRTIPVLQFMGNAGKAIRSTKQPRVYDEVIKIFILLYNYFLKIVLWNCLEMSI